MMRRLTVMLTALFAAGLLATGSAAAADPGDGPDQLTPREQAGLEFAGEVLGGLFGGGQG
ncbi:hypothetical protein C3486_24925 [Streptomyces sp. Ru73]|uniref:hypothetical protein n=1 Tax=Streptomyces sp. Ru73 TaxID=2080748 RepID=UPI000CDE37D1|nr:hypothetical protein [Streptomyces sp. Ru73]POX38106.1 hypothetical protein C3486_24925 [Streptomyces sp. Ru73]